MLYGTGGPDTQCWEVEGGGMEGVKVVTVLLA
jgi:hypothetical protein